MILSYHMIMVAVAVRPGSVGPNNPFRYKAYMELNSSLDFILKMRITKVLLKII